MIALLFVQIAVADPDLHVDSLVGSTVPVAGQDYTALLGLSNEGSVLTGDVEMALWVSDDDVRDANDTLLCRSRVSVGVFDSGDQHLEVLRCTWPAGLAATYVIGEVAVPVGGATERDLSDNSGQIGPVSVLGAGTVDLAVDHVQLAPRAVVGGDLDVAYTAVNHGTGTAGASRTRVWWSSDAVLDANDAVVCEGSLQAVVANGQRDEVLGCTTPAAAPGWYTVFVEVDGTGVLSDLDPTNDVFSHDVEVVDDLAELVLTATGGARLVELGETVPLSYEVHNAGTTASSPTRLVVDGDDDCAADVPALDAGARWTVDLDCDLGLDVGRWTVEAEVDEAVAGTTVVVPERLPDLAVVSVVAPATWDVDVAIPVAVHVSNAGDAATPLTEVMVLWSDDGALDRDDRRLCSMFLPELAPGEGARATLEDCVVPFSGNGHLVVGVDAGERVDEAREDNNLVVRPIALRAAPTEPTPPVEVAPSVAPTSPAEAPEAVEALLPGGGCAHSGGAPWWLALCGLLLCHRRGSTSDASTSTT
jgi:hypothetical protein